jgi:phosphotransferase system enzyme I (PtsI)
MVSTSSEVFSIRQALSEVENELHEKNIKHSDKYDIGIMLEVPSVLFGLEKLIEAVDYMSIGSNDLLQYVFAIDRGNELVADKYQVLHPIFLKIISQIAETFQKYPDKYLAICGEMAGNPMAVPFLIGAGIKDLSMSPVKIPAVKSVIKAFTLAECKELLDKALILNNPESVSCLIKEAFADKNIKAI